MSSVAADRRQKAQIPSWNRKRPPRWARILRTTVLWIVAVLVLVVVGFLVWAHTPAAAERVPFAAVVHDDRVKIVDAGDAFVLAPTGGASDRGLVFIPGALIDPLAYAYKLSGVVARDKVTVVITKPTLNLAFFDRRPLSAFTKAAPDVTQWYVGGHSLGGVRACQYAATDDVEGLVFFGSYCANDVSQKSLAVISLGGTNDGLSTPAKIDAARHLLPADATMIEIAGANHARFGDYGIQSGDGTATIGNVRMRAELTTYLSAFFRGD